MQRYSKLFILAGLTLLAFLQSSTSSWVTSGGNSASFPRLLPGTMYNYTIARGIITILTYNGSNDENLAVRLYVEALTADHTYPVIVVVKDQMAVMSWQIPVQVEGHHIYDFYRVRRTVCPHGNEQLTDTSIQIDLSTYSPQPLPVKVSANAVNIDLGLQQPKEVVITPSQPAYYRYTFVPEQDRVRVVIKSNDTLCGVLSIQDTMCPVYDQAKTITFVGKHETIRKKGAFAVKRNEFGNASESSFFVVLIVRPNDLECTQPGNLADEGPGNIDRERPHRMKKLMLEVLPVASSQTFISAMLATIVFFLITYLVAYLYVKSDSNRADIESMPSWGTDEAGGTTKKHQGDSYYVWNILTIAIFYGLPVMQLVFAYQRALNVSGRADICFYNFYCAFPFGPFAAFNNIFSNIGYVMLGFLFMLLVRMRQKRHDAQLAKCHRHKVINYFGLYYAMGIALMMEGFFSACYHVCPNASNFQFDTAFMYMIGWLTMLKIYQDQHPDINSYSHVVFFSMAIYIGLGVIGVFEGTWLFRAFFGILHLVTVFVISLQFYNKGSLKLSIVGAVFYPSPEDFDTYLLVIVVVNLLYYIGYTIIERYVSDGRPPRVPLFLAFGALGFWLAAVYFFVAKSTTSWDHSPAMSRERNHKCVLFNFYDYHDIWHFLSAIALFFSFATTFFFEDDVKCKEK